MTDQPTLFDHQGPSPQLVEKMKRLAAELLLQNGKHGVSVGDLRYSAENRGLLTGEESEAYMNALKLGKVMREAGGYKTGQYRLSKIKRTHGSPNVVYVLREFAEAVA